VGERRDEWGFGGEVGGAAWAVAGEISDVDACLLIGTVGQTIQTQKYIIIAHK
jgi:hypothetical protein